MAAYDIIVVTLITALVFFILKLSKGVYNLARLPPGPVGLPFLGVVSHFSDGRIVATIQRWKGTFGDIFSFSLPGQNIVVISSYELIKDVLLTRSNVFAGRPPNFRFSAFTDFQPVVGFVGDSPKLRMLKKTMSTSIKMYGERLLKLENASLDALEDLVKDWRSFDGKPFNPEASLQFLTGKIITSLTYGRLMTQEQLDENRALSKDVGELLRPGGDGQILEFLPWLRFFGLKIWSTIQKTKKRSKALLGKLIEDSMALYDGKNPECFLHSMYQSQEKLGREAGRTVLTDVDIMNQARAVVGAGTATTYTATCCFVAILTNHPELQARLQREVDEAVGEQTPRLADKEKMPYVEASLFELLRYTGHTPLLVPHSTTEDTTLGGYPLPKGTQVWVNAFGLHHDPRYWDEPWQFKPERFLDEQGKLVTPDHPNRRRSLPFGAGLRSCPGEVLAKNRLFLFMSCLLQNFTFRPVSDSERPDHNPLTYVHGLACRPQDYNVCALQR